MADPVPSPEEKRAAVIMPDADVQAPLYVSGRREYRRTAWAMVGVGSLMLVGPLALMVLSDAVYVLTPLVGGAALVTGLRRLRQ